MFYGYIIEYYCKRFVFACSLFVLPFLIITPKLGVFCIILPNLLHIFSNDCMPEGIHHIFFCFVQLRKVRLYAYLKKNDCISL